MKHIVPVVLIVLATLGLGCSIVATVLAFALEKQTLLFFPAVMLAVIAAITNVGTLLSSIVLKHKLTRVSAVISGLGLAACIVSFIVLATL